MTLIGAVGAGLVWARSLWPKHKTSLTIALVLCCLVFLLVLISWVYKRWIRERLADNYGRQSTNISSESDGIKTPSDGAMKVLAYLFNEGYERSDQDIQGFLKIQRSIVFAHIDELVHFGLIQRTIRGQLGSSSGLYELTPKGRAFVAKTLQNSAAHPQTTPQREAPGLLLKFIGFQFCVCQREKPKKKIFGEVKKTRFLKNHKGRMNIGWNGSFGAKNVIFKKACQTYGMFHFPPGGVVEWRHENSKWLLVEG